MTVIYLSSSSSSACSNEFQQHLGNDLSFFFRVQDKKYVIVSLTFIVKALITFTILVSDGNLGKTFVRFDMSWEKITII